MSGAATVLLSAGVGGALGIVSTAWKSRKDLESGYDIDLRQRRIEAYLKLWKLLEPLADYSPPGPVTPNAMSDLSARLRRWYFTTGGLVLSETTRAPYFNLQQGLAGAVKIASGGRNEEVDEDTREIVKALASRLRTSCTEDVATRVRPRLGESLMGRLRELWHRRFSPLDVLVDRRWEWSGKGPTPYYFVIVKNVSDRAVKVNGVTVAGAGPLRWRKDTSPFPFVLQPTEDRELAAAIMEPVGLFADVERPRVEKQLTRKGPELPAVPIPGHVLARPKKRPAA